jgi:hypothetical protein
MAGRYTGSYLARCDGWHAVAILADIGQASLVERIPIQFSIVVRAEKRGSVIAGLDPAIHSIGVSTWGAVTAWMRGSSPGMTRNRALEGEG